MDIETLADHYADREIMPKGHVKCPNCLGEGCWLDNHGWRQCHLCKGAGTVPIDKAIEYEAAADD